MPEDALLIESDTSRRLQVGRYARPGSDAVMQCGDSRKAGFQSPHRPRKGITQAGDELKQRQVAIADAAPDEMAIALRVVL
jgi:hypothetical protein